MYFYKCTNFRPSKKYASFVPRFPKTKKRVDVFWFGGEIMRNECRMN